MSVNKPIRRALISVYDKTGLEELARGLHEARVELVSTGSTAARIAAAGVPVTKVEELTGFPSAWTAASRRCTRACTPASSPTCASTRTASSSPSWAWSRSTWSW